MRAVFVAPDHFAFPGIGKLLIYDGFFFLAFCWRFIEKREVRSCMNSLSAAQCGINVEMYAYLSFDTFLNDSEHSHRKQSSLPYQCFIDDCVRVCNMSSQVCSLTALNPTNNP